MTVSLIFSESIPSLSNIVPITESLPLRKEYRSCNTSMIRVIAPIIAAVFSPPGLNNFFSAFEALSAKPMTFPAFMYAKKTVRAIKNILITFSVPPILSAIHPKPFPAIFKIFSIVLNAGFSFCIIDSSLLSSSLSPRIFFVRDSAAFTAFSFHSTNCFWTGINCIPMYVLYSCCAALSCLCLDSYVSRLLTQSPIASGD